MQLDILTDASTEASEDAFRRLRLSEVMPLGFDISIVTINGIETLNEIKAAQAIVKDFVVANRLQSVSYDDKTWTYAHLFVIASRRLEELVQACEDAF